MEHQQPLTQPPKVIKKKKTQTKKAPLEEIPSNATPVSDLYSHYNKNMAFLQPNSFIVAQKLPLTKCNCFWDRHPFDTHPIGCPIEFTDGKYISEGCFCSFNCCMAYIQDNIQNPKYTKSRYLLTRMHFEVFGDPKFAITPAPSWKVLDSYGGTWSIDQFRASLTNVIVTHKLSTSKLIAYRPIGHVFEEQIII